MSTSLMIENRFAAIFAALDKAERALVAAYGGRISFDYDKDTLGHDAIAAVRAVRAHEAELVKMAKFAKSREH